MQYIITRELEEAKLVESQMLNLDYTPIILPLIQRSKLSLPDLSFISNRPLCCILTSLYGIKIFCSEIASKIEYPEQVEFFVLSIKAKQMLEEAGFQKIYVSQAADSKSLANLIINSLSLRSTIPSIYYLSALETIGFMESALQEANIECKKLPIYKTEHLIYDKSDLERIFKQKEKSCLMFYSPSAVKAFIANIENLTECLEICSFYAVGQTTLECALGYEFFRGLPREQLELVNI
jgi:uroporphyrinogen-III synthase